MRGLTRLLPSRSRAAAFLACLWLAGCATAPPMPPAEPLFLDHAFAAPSERISAADVFALSDEMRHYVKTQLAAPIRAKGRQKGLIDALYGKGELKLEYDSSMTRNAAQAFAARSGNCLSLVIMTAAFARELDLRVEYQSAFADETWSRSGGLYFRSGHVNVTLGRRFMYAGGSHDATELTVDFLPADELRGLHSRVIDEPTVIAMYMNNRSAEALVRGRLDDAYGWAREAIVQAPAFLSSYITLGVVYLRRGELVQADRVFDRVLLQQPGNAQAISNRVQVLQQLGRAGEAEALKRRLAQIEPVPPFHDFNRGREALQRGDATTARELFAAEVRRAGYNPEFQFWLGVASWQLGDIDAARKHLGLAMEHSTNRDDRDLYAAKLGWLRSQQHR